MVLNQVLGTCEMPKKCTNCHVLLLNCIDMAESNGVDYFMNLDFFFFLSYDI